MRFKGLIVGAVLVLGTAGAVPVLAASAGGVTAEYEVDVLRGQDQFVHVEVGLDRDLGNRDLRIAVEYFDHRDQHEAPDGDTSYGWTIVTAPVIGSEGIYSQEYETDDGLHCISCKPIDTVCAVLADRC